MILKVPTGETLAFGDENFIQFEETGVREAQRAAFVLVAGGLGERLGYSGIKVCLVTLCHHYFCCYVILCIKDILCTQGSCKADVDACTFFGFRDQGCCFVVKIN